MPQSQARLAPAQYAFAPASKQITFAGVPGFMLDGLVLVVNAATGTVIYDPQFPGGSLGGTASGNTVTLAYDTTAMSASDPLRIIYNDLSREDVLRVFTPTATGPLAAIPIGSAQTLILDIQSSTNITCQVDVSVDGVNWKTGMVGRLPNLYPNPGDANANQGMPFNTRQYDVSAFRFARVNVTAISAGNPVLNVVLKTAPAPVRDVYVAAGNTQVSFDSGASIGYVRNASLYPEVVRGSLQSGATLTTGTLTGGVFSAGAVVTGGTRQAFGQPNPYYSRFGATVVSDQSGSLAIQASTDGTNWITVTPPGGVMVTGGTPLDYEVKVRAAFYRAVFTNGGTATGSNAFSLLAAFCGA